MQINDSTKNRREIVRLGLVSLVLQLALAPQLAIAQGHINFALVFAGIIALSYGGTIAVVCGFVAGLLFDLSATTPIGLMALLLTIMSFVMGIENRNRLSDDATGSLLVFLLSSFIVLLVYHFTMFLFGFASSFLDVLFMRTLPSFVLTGLAYLPFSYLMSRTHSLPFQFGGKTQRKARRSGGKYTLSKH